MAYAAVTDLITRYSERELIQLTDQSTPPTDAIDMDVAQAALDGGAMVIDGYVGVKYALPLATTPALLVELNCEIARYRLYADQATEQVATRYKDAIATLTKIANGTVKIDVAGVEPAPRPATVEASSNRRLFDRRSLRGA
ncbi:MAG TPA: phage protein Gp36 family protein [Caulobacteraceae bacterium]|nr:phage protein Gp36 family protein [Caulobacteraceae bacterium]